MSASHCPSAEEGEGGGRGGTSGLVLALDWSPVSLERSISYNKEGLGP